MTTTTLLLDIDGVINAVSEGYPRTNTGWTEWETAFVSFQDQDSSVSALLRNTEPKRGFRITYSPQLLRKLEELAARPDVEIKWLTTWCDDAKTHLCPAVGLDGTGWDVLGREEYDYDPWSTNYWWKAISAQRWWESEDRDDQRFVWLDDDLRYQRDAWEWVNTLSDKAMFISPNSRHGLSVKHMNAITEFIDR